MIYYNIPRLSDKSSNSYIIGTHAGEYAGGIPLANFGINAATKSAQFSAKAVQLSSQATQFSAQAAQFSAQAAQITDKMNNASKLTKIWNYFSGTGTVMAKEAAKLSSKASSATAAANSATIAANSANISAKSASAAGTLGKVFGVGLTVVGAAVGVGLGAYFTHKFCEELLDKYVEYYKKNCGKIQNSYIEAAEYFHQ